MKLLDTLKNVAYINTLAQNQGSTGVFFLDQFLVLIYTQDRFAFTMREKSLFALLCDKCASFFCFIFPFIFLSDSIRTRLDVKVTLFF